MTGIQILFYLFCALWGASAIAWVVCICVPCLRENYAYNWCLIPIWVFCLCMNITCICMHC